MTTHLFALGNRATRITAVAALVLAAALITNPASAHAQSPTGTQLLAEGVGMGATPSVRVRTVQRALRVRGYDLGRPGVDGRFGPLTAAAVRRFQRNEGLAVDGIVGPLTRRSLGVRRGGTGGTRRESHETQTRDRSQQGGRAARSGSATSRSGSRAGRPATPTQPADRAATPATPKQPADRAATPATPKQPADRAATPATAKQPADRAAAAKQPSDRAATPTTAKQPAKRAATPNQPADRDPSSPKATRTAPAAGAGTTPESEETDPGWTDPTVIGLVAGLIVVILSALVRATRRWRHPVRPATGSGSAPRVVYFEPLEAGRSREDDARDRVRAIGRPRAKRPSRRRPAAPAAAEDAAVAPAPRAGDPVAGYVRVDGGDGATSVDAIRAACDSAGWRLVDVVLDRVNGSPWPHHRSLRTALDRLAGGEIRGLLVGHDPRSGDASADGTGADVMCIAGPAFAVQRVGERAPGTPEVALITYEEGLSREAG